MTSYTPTEQYRYGGAVNFNHTKGDIGIYPQMFHQHLELFLLLGGKVEYIEENGRRIIPPNTLILIPPGFYHQFVVLGDIGAYERCVLEISPACHFFTHFEEITQERAMFFLFPGNSVFEAFARLRQYGSAPFVQDYAYLAEGVAAEILSLLRHEKRIDFSEAEKPLPLCAEAMEYIHTHLEKPLSLQSISDACFVASSTLSHAFRKSYGISVMQYIHNKKMAMAKQYILGGKTPGEVSRLCGYSEYSTFFRAYTKEYGCSPTLDVESFGAGGTRKSPQQ